MIEEKKKEKKLSERDRHKLGKMLTEKYGREKALEMYALWIETYSETLLYRCYHFSNLSIRDYPKWMRAKR